MSIQKSNINATKKLFEAFGAGDVPGILDYVNDDIRIEFYGPEVIPYAGIYNGRDEARGFFDTVLSSVTINQFDPLDMLADGDKVVVTGHLNLTANTTGGVIDSDFVHVITMRDEKWTRFRDFMDTAQAVAAFNRQ